MDSGFIRRTYRSTAFVTGFVLFALASYGQFWALLPVAGGVALGLVLLWTLEALVRGVFTPERASAARTKRSANPGRALLGAALFKYPLVGLVLWAAARYWNQREVMAFMGGFILVQAVIALRGVGRYMVERREDRSGKPPV